MSIVDDLENLSPGGPRRDEGGRTGRGSRSAERAERAAETERARRDGLTLLPELPGVVAARSHHRLFAVVAAVAAVVLVGSVFWGVSAFTAWRAAVGTQVSTAAVLDPAQRDAFVASAGAAEAAPAGTGAAPVVLAYHDIAPESSSEYVVTPQAFADQMAMLDAAGYTTLDSEQFTAYARGEYTPPARSAVITFDDGTSGLYTYADRILADRGFRAVSFVITGRVGTRAPYYLTWQQIERMDRSGRWSFGSHTAELHTRAPVGRGGQQEGSILTHREFDAGRLEGYDAFTRRVRTDLERSITDMTSRGLPRPTLFAWPFSEVDADDGADPGPLAFTRSEVDRLFTDSFVNHRSQAQPATVDDVRAGLVDRHEIVRSDSAQDLFEEMARMEQLPVGDLVPSQAAPTWLKPGGGEAPVSAVGADLTVGAPRESYVEADWAPQRTSAWDRYAVQARVSGLMAPTTPEGTPGRSSNDGGLRVRVGRVGEVAVRVSSTSVSVTRGGERVITAPLGIPGTTAALRLEVTDEQVLVLVDGQQVGIVPAQPGDLERSDGAQLPGSLGVVVQRGDDPAAPMPVLSELRAGTLP